MVLNSPGGSTPHWGAQRGFLCMTAFVMHLIAWQNTCSGHRTVALTSMQSPFCHDNDAQTPADEMITLGHSLFGLVFSPSLSGIATCTHRHQGVIIVGIYMSSNIYYLLLLYLSRKELRMQTNRLADVCLCATFSRNFRGSPVRRLQAYSSASLLSPLV